VNPTPLRPVWVSQSRYVGRDPVFSGYVLYGVGKAAEWPSRCEWIPPVCEPLIGEPNEKC
jgi:hypothetical protein